VEKTVMAFPKEPVPTKFFSTEKQKVAVKAPLEV